MKQEGTVAPEAGSSVALQQIVVKAQVHRSAREDQFTVKEQEDDVPQQTQICISPKSRDHVEEFRISPLLTSPKMLFGSSEKIFSPISLLQPRVLLSPVMSELRIT